jgi:TetR/AcrR family transcriptional regulator, cholesterol catabolism regulator
MRGLDDMTKADYCSSVIFEHSHVWVWVRKETMHEETSRRERKKEETRHRIFHAAVDLFRERGFEHTTVDDITEKADVAKGTFFNYFPRKEAVLGYLSEERLVAIEENTASLYAEDRNAREKLIDVYLMAASAYEEDQELARFVLVEMMRRAFGPNEETALRWHAIIETLLRQGQERGEMRAGIPFERGEMLLSGVFFSTLFQWACCRDGIARQIHPRFQLQEELRARLTLIMEGFAS